MTTTLDALSPRLLARLLLGGALLVVPAGCTGTPEAKAPSEAKPDEPKAETLASGSDEKADEEADEKADETADEKADDKPKKPEKPLPPPPT